MVKELIERLRDPQWSAEAHRYESADALERLTAENLRLAGEVSNRNSRALAGDTATKQFDAMYEDIERLTAHDQFLADANKQWMADCERLTAERDALVAAKDGAYLERNQLVALLSKVFPAGKKQTAIEGWSEDWHGCVYIDLPTGQASWHYHDSQAYLFDHLPEYQGVWDGHTTDEKYERIAAIQGAGK